MCVVDETGKIVWRGIIDTHPEMLASALKRCEGKLTKVGLESGPFTPHLFRQLMAMGYPMVRMDAGRPMRLRVGGSRATRPTSSLWPDAADRLVLAGARQVAG
jgi:hypothetical protein